MCVHQLTRSSGTPPLPRRVRVAASTRNVTIRMAMNALMSSDSFDT